MYTATPGKAGCIGGCVVRLAEKKKLVERKMPKKEAAPKSIMIKTVTVYSGKRVQTSPQRVAGWESRAEWKSNDVRGKQRRKAQHKPKWREVEIYN